MNNRHTQKGYRQNSDSTYSFLCFGDYSSQDILLAVWERIVVNVWTFSFPRVRIHCLAASQEKRFVPHLNAIKNPLGNFLNKFFQGISLSIINR